MTMTMTSAPEGGSASPASPASPAAPAAASSAGNGAAAPDGGWRAQLPEDIRDHPSLTRYSDWEGLARGYLNAEQLIGRDKVPIPRDDSDEEAWDRWYAAAGRPEAPDRYDLQKPETLPEGVTYDEQMEAWWRQTAHGAGLSSRQFTRLFEAYRDRVIAGAEAARAAAEAEVTAGHVALRRDWGEAYDLQRQLARAEFKSMPEEVQQLALQSGLARKPAFVKWLAGNRERVTGELQTQAVDNGLKGATPQQLSDQIAQHRSAHEKVLMNRDHPEHALRLRELSAMYARLYPEPS
jgi:hypothetical protein